MDRAAILQLSLPLGVPHNQASTKRVWLVAGEPGQAEGLASVMRRDGHGYRHAFVNAGTGFGAIGPDDLILLRSRQRGQFDVLVPDHRQAMRSLGEPLDVKGLLGKCRVDSSNRSGPSDLVAISFVPGQLPGRARTRGQHPRSGLERLLSALRTREAREHTATSLSICSRAEAALDERVHPALRGLFHREYADGLASLLDGTEDVGAALEAMARAYIEADRDFRQCDFAFQSKATRQNRQRAFRRHAEPGLPGIASSSQSKKGGHLGFHVRPFIGLQLSFQVPEHLSWPVTAGGSGSWRSAGAMPLSDQEVLALMAGAPAGRPRLTATVQKDRHSVRVRVDLGDELDAFVGLDSRAIQGAEASMIFTDSASLRFSPSMAFLTPGSAQVFEAKLPKRLRHKLALRVLAGPGQGSSLILRV